MLKFQAQKSRSRTGERLLCECYLVEVPPSTHSQSLKNTLHRKLCSSVLCNALFALRIWLKYSALTFLVSSPKSHF